MSSIDERHTTPPKSPTRSYRGSPLKAAKDKFSSIMKTSRSLFASSAATSTLTPSSNRFATGHPGHSFEDVFAQSNDKAPLYPVLDNGSTATVNTIQAPSSPPKAVPRKTRASTEREERQKEEEARQVKEAKEAQKMANQLEKARLKEKDKARVFHQEQERVALMQKEVDARKDQEKQAKASQVDIPRATRSSPRKTKAQLEAEGIASAAASTEDFIRDAEMSDASAMPPPAIPRPKSQIGRPGPKRPLRPAKETLAKAKPPTVIKVDMQRGHQYHPSNTTLAATLQESLSAPSGRPGLHKKASTSSIQGKASVSSFKATASRAIEAAARKKEQDEIAAQRKRQLKEENERQRAALKEENERQRAALKEEERRKEEQQRRQEAERQRELKNERERVANAADAKKAASRQAMEKRRLELEKAKQMGAPPPASRSLHDKALPPVPRGEASQSKPVRQQEEMGRPASQASHNVAKPLSKRPLQQEVGEDQARPAIQRNGPSYEQLQSKRRKTSERFEDDEDMTENQPRMNAPPIRQSSSRPKHNMTHSKPAHPMDMAQMSKGPIPFASSTNQPKAQPYKTPIRPGGVKGNMKSAAKSSPQYQNGETIDLPEINTDSEDDDEDEDDSAKKPAFKGASWIESPALRKQLTEQENIDPATIFGQADEHVFDMEQVFNKSKDKFPKFRDRTSSANWGGIDRLTEDEIRKDLQARQRMQRAGGWEYNSMV
ncbi:putative Inner centromere protein-related protein pic1 [Glarea lozoyensis 74030]|uniref:Putative Inner centromere protein-related protein pic1 n=1 Tax=Glarea lozoyensis (strain ATCC 74030 / MF5533) TaxID=1104152 RepID=H0EVW1_GLAL7|nr:putative Inner centromere protein-related protein pic1 [Glarea lozoyensis 74030]